MRRVIREISPKEIIITIQDVDYTFYYRTMDNDAVFIDFVVASEVGTGMGYFAFKQFEDIMKKRGFKRLLLIPENGKLQRLYENYGFSVSDGVMTKVI